MKIAYSGIEIEEGKIKYYDSRLEKLAEKFDPEKKSPFYFEFIESGYTEADAIAVTEETLLDLLIIDIEKFEARVSRSEADDEKKLAAKCLEILESEKPLFNEEFNSDEEELLRTLSPVSFKPVVICDKDTDTDSLIEGVLEAAGYAFFYTAGKKEVHAWLFRKGVDIVDCAGKIHSDLARGFIKGDVSAFDKFMQAHNMKDAQAKGLGKVVDRDYIVQDGDIIEIRFNV